MRDDEKVRGILTEKISRTPAVESFRFTVKQKMDFSPGQFLQVIFDEDQTGSTDLNKYLSFSSSPTREYIEVTKRMSKSKFSQRLKNLKIGEEVLLKGPLGACVFKAEYKKIAFLIGGIGITPVISILEYVTDKKINSDAILLYSNQTQEEIAFKKELDCFQATNKNIRIFYTLTDCPSRDRSCIFGRIDKDLVVEKIQDFHQRIFFIFGPPRMTKAMNSLCLGMSCLKENIKIENFIGY